MSEFSEQPEVRRPPLWAALLLCAALILLLVWLRLVMFEHRAVGIGYALPIVLVGWTRRRSLIWGMCGVFLCMAVTKFWLNHDNPATTTPQKIIGFLMLSGDLLVVAGIVDLVIRREAILRWRGYELQRRSQELRVSNETLRERQDTLESLLKLSRTLIVGQNNSDIFAAIAGAIRSLLGDSIAVAMWEARGDKIEIIGHHGFGKSGPDVLSGTRSDLFAGLVMNQQKCLSVVNASLRPEMKPARGRDGETFPAMLGTPLKSGSEIVGSLVLHSPQVRSWTESDIALLESLAAQASVSLAATKLVEQLENEQRYLQTVVDTVPFGIVRTDARATRLISNPAGAEMLGFPELIEGAKEGWPKAKLIGPAGEIAPGKDPLMRALRGEVTAATELEIQLPDGGKLTALCNAAPIRDRSGAISGAIGAFVDISKQKQLREELDQRRRDAEEASVRKSKFLAAVSHDIRNPANAISLLAELVRRLAEDPSQLSQIPEIARELERSAMSLVNLVTDILDLTRLELGRLEMHETEFEMGKWLTEECGPLQVLAANKHLEFVCNAPNSGIRLRGDRIKLTRVLGNLIGNAIKFTEQGRVVVEAGLLPDSRPRVSVTDTGIGIAAENLSKIFDEFAQLKSPERSKVSGSGLGLAISRRLIEAMSGKLDVVSEPGNGSTFSFTLPPTSVVGSHP
jgi:PAS domain S-box-containing protein